MKNVLIVGASSGIGLAAAQTLSTDYNVYTTSRSEVPSSLSASAAHFLWDASQESQEVFNQLPEELHGLLYCPGTINLKPFNRLTTADFLKDFEVNVLGAVKVIQAVAPRLKRANGASVVLFSTVAAKAGMSFHASIAASKSAVEGFAKSLAAEYAASKIRFNVIAPSLTDTPLAAALLSTDEKKEAAAKRHPLQIIGRPIDSAAMACFLLKDEAQFITGQVIGVDGGMGALR
jgi:NAD(P)-dependent dehydrogenase (short-subunit alcohol dehydrogenase family)